MIEYCKHGTALISTFACEQRHPDGSAMILRASHDLCGACLREKMDAMIARHPNIGRLLKDMRAPETQKRPRPA